MIGHMEIVKTKLNILEGKADIGDFGETETCSCLVLPRTFKGTRFQEMQKLFMSIEIKKWGDRKDLSVKPARSSGLVKRAETVPD